MPAFVSSRNRVFSCETSIPTARASSRWRHVRSTRKAWNIRASASPELLLPMAVYLVGSGTGLNAGEARILGRLDSIETDEKDLTACNLTRPKRRSALVSDDAPRRHNHRVQ